MKAVRPNSYGQSRQFSGLELWAIRRRQRVALQALRGLVHARPGAELRVLELGCGYLGANLQMMAAQFPLVQFTGLDVHIFDEGTSPQIQLIQGDIEVWQPKKQYDLVMSLAVVEHLARPAEHFGVIAGCLKPDGLAVLTTPTPLADIVLRSLARAGIFDRGEILDHQTYLTESGIRSFCRRAKLEIMKYGRASFGMNHTALMRKEVDGDAKK